MSLWDKIKQFFIISSSPSDIDEFSEDTKTCDDVEAEAKKEADAHNLQQAIEDDEAKTNEVEMLQGDQLK